MLDNNSQPNRWVIKSLLTKPTGVNIVLELDKVKGWIYILNNIHVTLINLPASMLDEYLEIVRNSNKLPEELMKDLEKASMKCIKLNTHACKHK